MASAQPAGVRFAAQNQEIAPDHSLEDIQMSNERDGDDSNPNSEQKQNGASKDAGRSPPKSSIFETVMGLGLFVVVGVGAAWMAFMMHDPIKDGGAALTGAS